MSRTPTHHDRRERRHRRIRARVHGTAVRPRLSVFRSGKHIAAQIIDDVRGVTLCAATDAAMTAAPTTGENKKVSRAHAVGLQIAEAAKKVGITTVTFDRAGYAYHGRVKAVAEGAREGGLAF